MTNQFSKMLRGHRQQLNLKLREIAALIGIDSTLISRFESGERLPTQPQLDKLIQALGLDSAQAYTLWLAAKIYADIAPYREAAAALSIVSDVITEYRSAILPVHEGLQQILDQADQLKAALRQLRPLDGPQLAKLNDYFNQVYTYESNRIEGNTLSLQETALVLEKGITIGGKSMREHLEAINHKEAVEYIRDLAQQKISINERVILDLHNLILRGIDTPNAGIYRTHGVRIGGSRHLPPDALHIREEMDRLLLYYEENRLRLHPILLAADMHAMLVGVHPFVDGNGRSSRLLMNLILLQHGYGLANLKGDLPNRLEYYQALEKAQVDMDPEPFRHLVAQHVLQGLEEYYSILDH